MSMIRTMWKSGYPDKPELKGTTAMAGAAAPRTETPIVPRSNVAGSALVAVVAIMTFLASLTAGGVALVLAAAAEWQAEVVREATIQIRPMPGRDIEADVVKAVDIARRLAAVSEVRPYTRAESARLLEPWLGTGLALEDLPVPRIVVIKFAPGQTADLAAIGKQLSEQLPAASLDDHRAFAAKMRGMAGAAGVSGLAILALVLIATWLSVAFATRGAMATNKPIIEVLHVIGAKNDFIASQFQRHFLVLGFKGGLIGGGAATIVFVLLGLMAESNRGSAGADQMSALFGSFAISALGYAGILAQIAVVAGVTAVTSRRIVLSTLDQLT